MEEKAFFLIIECLLEHSSISRTWLQRKLRISSKESEKIIKKFLLEYFGGLCKNCRKFAEDLHKNSYNISRQKSKNQNKDNMIVVFGGAKGGVGKSTLAINLVTFLAANGMKVLFVDADRIRSSSKFVEHRLSKQIPTPWRTICLQNNLVSTEVLSLKKEFDQVIIDAGGGDTVSQRHAIGIADLFIMPFNPSFPDLETLEEMRQIIALAKPFNPNLKVAALLNQSDYRGKINEQGRGILERDPIINKVLNTLITRRVSIRNAWSTGLGIAEMKPRDEKAYTELTNLYREIYEQNTRPGDIIQT